MNRQQLADLVRPFPSYLIHTNPSGGGHYVTHAVVKQRVLDVFDGPISFELVQVIRGDVAGVAPNPHGKSDRAKNGTPALTNAVVGAVCRLTLPDGTRLEDVGDCEQPHNWPHDGARMKDAMSDAFKRCAAQIGVGLHLWCKDGEFRLYEKLKSAVEPLPSQGAPAVPGGGKGTAAAPHPDNRKQDN